MSTGTHHAVQFGHGILTRFTANGFPAALGQIWANCGIIIAIATGSVGATVIWFVGAVGLALFHLSRAAVVWLERPSRLAKLQKQIEDLRDQHTIDVKALRDERAEHARDRERFLVMVEQVLAVRQEIQTENPDQTGTSG